MLYAMTEKREAIFVIRPFHDRDEEPVIALWRECGLVVPSNDPRKDIRRQRREDPGRFLVAERDGRIVGAIMFGYDGHRGSVNYLAVAPACRKLGLGRLLMDRVEADLRALGCPKINLNIRHTNTEVRAFYERLNGQVVHR